MSGISGKIPYGAGLTVKWKNSNEKGMLARRNTRPGYPIEKKFTTKEEITEYLSQEKITCLLCGRNYKALGNHIQIHNFSVEQYKLKYGLPFQKGLTCPTSVEINSNNMKKRQKEGSISKAHLTQEFYQKNANKSAEIHKERYQPFRVQNDLAILKKAQANSQAARKARTHCKYGHPYNENRRCPTCDIETSRRLKGTMDRELSKKIIVIMKCAQCGGDRPTCRLRKGMKILYCTPCLEERKKQWQTNYKIAHPERKKESIRKAQAKRKERLKALKEESTK